MKQYHVEHLSNVKNEIEVIEQIKYIDNPYTIKVYKTDLSKAQIITEFCSRGDLTFLINRNEKLTENSLRVLMSKIFKS